MLGILTQTAPHTYTPVIGTSLVNQLRNTITSTYATSTVPLQILYKQQSNNSTETQTILSLAHEATSIYAPAAYQCFNQNLSIDMQLDRFTV